MKYMIGIDIGGTNTDCVLVGIDGVIYNKMKLTTSDNMEEAVVSCIQYVMQKISPSDIARICLGTTFATNAILEAKRLLPVGIIRLAGQKPTIPPGYGWSQSLIDTVICDVITLDGGSKCDATPITAFCEKLARTAIQTLIQKKAQAIAIVGVYAPINNQEEQIVKKMVQELAPDIFVSSSSEIGGLGFLQRESATILNASLKHAMQMSFSAIEREIRKLRIKAPFFMVKNDGSVMPMLEAIVNPIFTIAAGQTNSFYGASSIAQKPNSIVVDIGGTSTDIGLVMNGVPKRSCREATIGSVKLQFPMPNAISLAIGGGTIIEVNGLDYTIGPKSVGKNLFQEAISFGGSILTLTDIALMLGKIEIPASLPERVPISPSLARRIMDDVESKILQSVRLMKGKQDQLDVLLCGGGAQIGLQQGMHAITDAGFANAYGAACAGISYTVDRTCCLFDRENVLDTLKKEAIAKTKKLGAHPQSIHISHVEIAPYAYSKEALARVIISASGRYDKMQDLATDF